VYNVYIYITNKQIMKTLNELQKELQDLKLAYSNKYLTTNEYCSIYYEISKQIKLTTN